nr:MAG TPA: hypothetical protein [Caudoviricetes sp.]
MKITCQAFLGRNAIFFCFALAFLGRSCYYDFRL